MVNMSHPMQQTDIGPIPTDWELRLLSDLGEPKIGLTYSPADVRESGTLVLRSSNVQNDRLAFDDNVFVRPEIAGNSLVELGDILICVRNGSRALIGKCAKIDEAAKGMAFGAFMSVFRSPHSKWLFQQFRSDIIGRQITEHLGATINQITNGSLKSFRVPFPPDEEERNRIAQALSDMDDLIASLDTLIAKKQDIKQGAMQQLLTGKRRLPGFSGEWATVDLGSLCSMKSGAGITSRTISDSGPFPVYGANGLRGFTNSKTHSGVFPLIGRVGALCGNIQVARGDFFASEHAIVAEPKGKTDPEWLALALGRLGLNRLSEASAQPVLTVGKLAVLPVFAPSDPQEQREISGVIFAMQDELRQIHARLSKLREVRQGMMQQLLTGRIRLI